jgi:hypothetical protein
LLSLAHILCKKIATPALLAPKTVITGAATVVCAPKTIVLAPITVVLGAFT